MEREEERLRGAAEAARHFRMEGELAAAEPFGHGHIHDTYRLAFKTGSGTRRYILQRVNLSVFKDPLPQFKNIERVLAHLKTKIDDPRRVQRIVRTQDGSSFWKDGGGRYWRATEFVEKTSTFHVVRSPEHAYQAARAFGLFQSRLADLPGPPLNTTIPDFHNTPKRLADFKIALSSDPCGRAKGVRRETDFALAHEALASALEELRTHGDAPDRIAHNDTKIDNVLFDDETGEGLCVIDLDTVMPGMSLHDFGDLARSAVSPAAEDEPDLGKVVVRVPVYEALAKGWLESCGRILTSAEKGSLALSARVIAYELGLRFLTDHLLGDVYFKTHRPGHNLERCRVQFRLAELIEGRQAELDRLVLSV